MPIPTARPELEHAPSAWVARWAAQIPQGGRVLDVACGSGRHAAFLARHGFMVEGVDIDLSACAAMQKVSLIQADLENAPWPFAVGAYKGVVVTNYLHRPLFPRLIEALAPGGVLIYETFALGNERYGRPKNPNFLLLPGELLEVARGKLAVLGYEDILLESPRLARVQRICARR